LAFIGELSIGTFSGVMLLTPKVTETMVKCCYFFRDLVHAATALQRLEDLFNAAEPAADTVSDSALDQVDEVKLDDVSFSYDPGLKLLDKFNLSIKKKQSLAILGRSGTGKSTLFKLMMGFYGPVKGEVKINDAGIRHYRHDTLGKVCGVVFQDERNLVNGTIRDNIALVKPDATDEEIEAAAKTANIHDFIQTLPKSYDSPVGEHGRLLSGGQRKQIALARAILHKPNLLLLDDVAAELDPDAEEAINLAIRALSEQCAVIYTTHRLTSALYADNIAVLDQGRICEYGTHKTLLEQKGLYYKFWQF
jgi:ATP-binding cassette subfamily B protein